VIGGMEWIILILFVVLLLFGAKKIPEFARSLGKAKAEFQRGQMQVEREIREERSKYDEEDRIKRAKKRDKVKDAAKALGIDIEGKSENELRNEIAKQMS
jgi:sec-independent protein translocase protein TatA